MSEKVKENFAIVREQKELKTEENSCSEGRFKKTGVVMQKKTNTNMKTKIQKYKSENKNTKMEIRESEVKVWWCK